MQSNVIIIIIINICALHDISFIIILSDNKNLSKCSGFLLYLRDFYSFFRISSLANFYETSFSCFWRCFPIHLVPCDLLLLLVVLLLFCYTFSR